MFTWLFIPAFIAAENNRTVGKWALYSVALWPIALVHASLIPTPSLWQRTFRREDERAHCGVETQTGLTLIYYLEKGGPWLIQLFRSR